jgi:ABC-type dipeptide/oligopeptide/nickel transport system permease component
MHRFIVERLIQSVVIVALVSVIVFLFVHASGDPAALLVPEQGPRPLTLPTTGKPWGWIARSTSNMCGS